MPDGVELDSDDGKEEQIMEWTQSKQLTTEQKTQITYIKVTNPTNKIQFIEYFYVKPEARILRYVIPANSPQLEIWFYDGIPFDRPVWLRMTGDVIVETTFRKEDGWETVWAEGTRNE